MIQLLGDMIFDGGIALFGSPALFCMFLMALFFFAFIWFGLEFDYSLILISPIPYAFYQSGYFEIWISSLFMIFPLAIGIYSVWVKFNNKG